MPSSLCLRLTQGGYTDQKANPQALGGGQCMRKMKAREGEKGCWSKESGARSGLSFVVVRKGLSDKLAF